MGVGASIEPTRGALWAGGSEGMRAWACPDAVRMNPQRQKRVWTKVGDSGQMARVGDGDKGGKDNVG
jgi:hypothetical protein